MDSLKDDLETLDPAEEVQKAFDQSVNDNWTPARQSAAMSLGVDILTGVFKKDIKRLEKTGTYPNVYRDVIIVLWLRDLPWEEVTRINARVGGEDPREQVEECIAKAYAWAETEGLSYASPKFREGVRTMLGLVKRVFTSFYAVEGNGKPESALKKSTGQPGKSASVSTPLKLAEKALATS
jgi:hypothetical protein